MPRAPLPSIIQLADALARQEIRAVDENLARLYLALGKEREAHAERERALLEAVAKSKHELSELSAKAARAVGIDPNHPTERWTFEVPELRFRRTG